MRTRIAKRRQNRVVIRKYRPNDRQSCRELWAELTEWHRQIYHDTSIGGADPGRHFEVHLKEYGSENIWVAEIGGKLAGMAGLIRSQEGMELEPLIVSEKYRSRGIGGMLTEAIISAAKEQGARMLSVSPVARNDLAVRFFHDTGFDTLGHLEMFIDFSPANRQKWKRTKRLSGRNFRY